MTALLAAMIALAHAAVAVVALRVGARRGLTRFAGIVAAYAAALVLPTTLTIWVLWLPVGLDGALAISSSLIIGAALFGLIAGRLPAARPRLRPARRHLAALAPALAIVALVALALIAALGKPVEEIDGLLYHGPAAANAIQHESLFGWDAPAPYVYYPSFIAIQGATVVLLTGSTALLDAVQIPYMLLLALVIWAWAGRGRATPLAGVLGAIVIATPAVTGNARALYVDVAYAAVLLAGAWLISLAVCRRGGALLVAGASLVGVAAAIKPAGLTVCVALGATLVGVALVRRTRGAVVAAAASLAGLVVGGAAFYLRNLVEFGNPLYPVGTTVAGVRLDGLVDLGLFQSPPPPPLVALADPLALLHNIWLGATTSYDGISYDARIGAFGPVMWLLAALALVAAIGLMVRRPRPRQSQLALLGVPVSTAVLILLTQPQAWYPRYVIAVIALAAVVIGLALDRVRVPARAQTALALAVLVPLAPLAWSTENRLVQGIPAIRAPSPPNYNQGIGGFTVAYQDEYAWVRDQPCGTRVVVASTAFQQGLLNTYGIGLWGDGLCFRVTIVRDRRGEGEEGLGGDRARLIRMVPRADFVVAFEVDRPLVEESAALAGRTAEVVSDTFPFFGADQVVYRIRSAEEPAG